MTFDEVAKNVWTLKNLTGQLLGLQIRIAGELRNADKLTFQDRDQKRMDPEVLAQLKKNILQALNILETFETSVPPRLLLNLNLNGDRNFPSYAEGIFDLADVAGEYGRGEGLRMVLSLADVPEDKSLESAKLQIKLKRLESDYVGVCLDDVALDCWSHIRYEDLQPQNLNVSGSAGWVSNRVCNVNGFWLKLLAQRRPVGEQVIDSALDFGVNTVQVSNVGNAQKTEFHADVCGIGSNKEKTGGLNDLALSLYQTLLQAKNVPDSCNFSLKMVQPRSEWGSLDLVDAKFRA